MTDNLVECKTCGELFDPNDPYNSEVGYIWECGDCGLERGDDKIKVRAFTGFNEDGDWEGIEIVSNDEYEEYQKVTKLYDDK